MIRNLVQTLITITVITVIAVPMAGQDAASTLVRLAEISRTVLQAKVLRVSSLESENRVLFKKPGPGAWLREISAAQCGPSGKP